VADLRAGVVVGVLLTAAVSVGCGVEGTRSPGHARPPAAPAAPAARGGPVEPLWVGRSFAGLPLTHEEPGLLVYGTCRPPAGEGGCAPPLQLQLRPLCEAHPLRYSGTAAVPERRWRVRRALAARYGREGDGHTDLYTGTTAVRIFAPGEVAVGDVLAVLRPRFWAAPRARVLAPPRFPASVLAELRRVRRAHARLGSVAAVRRHLGISRSAVRDRLALEREVRALGRVRPADC